MTGTRPLVLSLFPGIGLLDLAFEEAGFCVVRGPDLIWGGNVRTFHPRAGAFAGIIGGPPCQAHTTLKALSPTMNRYGNMMPEFERVVDEAGPEWFVSENVMGAPIPDVRGYQTVARCVSDVAVGGLTSRKRRICFGYALSTQRRLGYVHAFTIDELALCNPEPEHAAIGGHGPGKGRKVRGFTGRDWKENARVQGLSPEWIQRMAEESPLTAQGLKDAIGNGVPLAIGRAVAAAVKRAMGYSFSSSSVESDESFGGSASPGGAA